MRTHAPHPPKSVKGTHCGTRERLLEAAGAVFAEQGFRHATVREICRRAGANVAAIHYHFGDKMGLYQEALRYGAEQALRAYPVDRGIGENSGPEERLRAYVHGLLERLLNAQYSWYGRLMTREMIDPTPALDSFIADVVKPLAGRLMEIVRDILGPGAEAERVRLCGWSIIGQCLFYKNQHAVLERLEAQDRRPVGEVARIAEHIVSFSLAGMGRTPVQSWRR